MSKLDEILKDFWDDAYDDIYYWQAEKFQIISNKAKAAIIELAKGAVPEEANYDEENEAGVIFKGTSWNACLQKTLENLDKL